MTLEDAGFNVSLRIEAVELPDAAEKARLSGVGLRAGAAVVKIMPTPLQDPVSCKVGAQLLAVERRLLRRVRVVLS